MTIIWIVSAFVITAGFGDIPINRTLAFSTQQKCEEWVAEHERLHTAMGRLPKAAIICDELKVDAE